ncbi:MAG: glycosyltransferase [Prevotellaceae bacterium]|jgi:hypothetical protein|nr:glycosyltransferase [Prevotellaceae bacterium]
MATHLNIVAFNVPYPPNYGGVIDVYYLIETLHRLGVKVLLHCFTRNRDQAPALERLCEAVWYYPRRTGWRANLSLLPYNVYGRRDEALLANLLSNEYPILFEGLHTCYYLTHPRLSHRQKLVRCGNIEHDYYRAIAAASHGARSKLFHLVEAARFRCYERVLRSADILLAISETDARYLSRRYPNEVVCIPAFHQGGETVTSKTGQSDFILYHGNLSVPENERAAEFLLMQVFGHLPYRCVIAGMNPPERLQAAVAGYPHVVLEANPSDSRLEELVQEAHIHLLITFQPTGLKLKLLHSLFSGRHVVVNSAMLAGSGLDAACCIADDPAQLIAACHRLMHRPFTDAFKAARQQILLPTYSNTHQGQRLLALLHS